MAVSDLNSLIAMLRSDPLPSPPTLERMRERHVRREKMVIIPDDVRVQAISANGVPCDWISAPSTSLERAILYLHGGGYTTGSPRSYCRLCYDISRAANARVLAVDYRLAPEQPFPAALEDALAAWRWILSQGIAPQRAAIMGDSAGGGLALTLALSLRDNNMQAAACISCISPLTDLANTGNSLTANAVRDPSVTLAALAFAASSYLHEADPRNPLASPLYANCAGLPPVLIQVGSVEVLLDDSVRMAENLKSAGVDVECEVWPLMPHIWHIYAPALPEGRAAIERAGSFIDKNFMQGI